MRRAYDCNQERFDFKIEYVFLEVVVTHFVLEDSSRENYSKQIFFVAVGRNGLINTAHGDLFNYYKDFFSHLPFRKKNIHWRMLQLFSKKGHDQENVTFYNEHKNFDLM